MIKHAYPITAAVAPVVSALHESQRICEEDATYTFNARATNRRAAAGKITFAQAESLRQWQRRAALRRNLLAERGDVASIAARDGITVRQAELLAEARSLIGGAY